MRDNKQTIELLKDLVSLRSDVDAQTSQNESAVGAYINHFFQKLPGFDIQTQCIEEGRFIIVATTSADPKLVFIGHMDTVPITNVEQLTPQIRGDFLYGRGCLDMKAGIAIMLSLARMNRWKDVAFVFTVGEEYDFIGAKSFIASCPSWKPDLVMNLEPTSEQLLQQCRGVTELTLLLCGKTAHAGNKNEGVNAIECATLFRQKLELLVREYDEQPLVSSVNLAGIEGGVAMEDNIIVTRPNMVPDAARITIEIRLGSGSLTPLVLQRLVEKALKRTGVTLKEYQQGLWFGPLLSSERVPYIDTFPPQRLDPNTSGFFEVQLVQEAWQCPVIIFGPGPASQAHTVDEYVDLTSVERVEQTILSYLTKREKDAVQ